MTANLKAAFTTLLLYYNASTGYFGDPNIAWPFWTSGVALEACADYFFLTSDPIALSLIENSYLLVRKDYNVPCDPDQPGCVGNDDIQWHGHAWLSAFEATANTTYLSEALGIYRTLLEQWGAWNATCGGMNWAMQPPYVNTVTNGLFMEALVRLWAAGAGEVVLASRTVAQWAQLALAWSQRPGLLSPQGVLVDGFSTQNCSQAVGAVWSYNQGLWVSGLAGLGALQASPPLALASQRLAQGAAQALSREGQGSPSGAVMLELSCSAEGWCEDYSGQQFKGVYAHRLGRAVKAWGPGPAAGAACAWLRNNSNSLLERGAGVDGAGNPLLGQLWQGPFSPQRERTPWVPQAAGFQLLLALELASAVCSDPAP